MKKKITYKALKAMSPCYKPQEIGIKSDYSATISKFIKEYRNKVQSKEDIVWVLCRKEYMTDRDLRLFAVWCAREALKLDSNPDPRSVNACNIAEKFANGDATQEEEDAARATAWAAAGAAVGAAVGAAEDATWAAQIDKLLTYFKE